MRDRAVRHRDRHSPGDAGDPPSTTAAATAPRETSAWRDPHSCLAAAAVGYLLLPNLLFQLGYLRPDVGLPAFVVTCWAGLVAMRHIAREPSPRHGMPWTPAAWCWLIVGVTLWVSLSGAGGIGFQNHDWQKSNAILRDLVARPWPVAYATEAWPEFGPGDFVLVYYIGYYLPAATVGKAGGWIAANLALFAWTVLGVTIAVALMLEWLRTPSVRAVCVMLVVLVGFGGLDLVGYVWLRGVPAPSAHIDWWNFPWFQYPSLTSHLLWAPQHAVAAWVATSVVLHHLDTGVGLRRLALVTSAALLTTPFAVLGLLPFGVVSLARAIRTRRVSEILSLENAIGVTAIAMPVGFFLASSAFSFPVEFLPAKAGFWLAWSRLVALEVLFLVPFVWHAPHRLVLLAAGTLMLLPLWRIGLYNDLVMRASIPASWVLCACTVRVLLRVAHPDRTARGRMAFDWAERARRPALIVVLCLAAGASVQELWRAATFFQVGRIWDPSKVKDVVGPGSDARLWQRHQYQGHANSLFFRHFGGTPIPPRARDDRSDRRVVVRDRDGR